MNGGIKMSAYTIISNSRNDLRTASITNSVFVRNEVSPVPNNFFTLSVNTFGIEMES